MQKNYIGRCQICLNPLTELFYHDHAGSYALCGVCQKHGIRTIKRIDGLEIETIKGKVKSTFYKGTRIVKRRKKKIGLFDLVE